MGLTGGEFMTAGENPIALKELVRDHWEREVCGSRYGTALDDRRRYFAEIEAARYQQDYMLRDFARFEEARGRKVLEVGIGAGTDFVQWARAGAPAYGRDLTQASVDMVRERLELEGLHGDIAVGDAESLGFPDDFFDVYYSWGVLHHTPDTQKALAEAHRVLKPGGVLKIMLYHFPSVGAMLVWLLYGPLRLNFQGPRALNAQHVESPGTKFYTVEEARQMVGRYFDPATIRIRTFLGSGDLLTHRFSEKYQGWRWKVAGILYPRWFVRHFLGHRWGGVMTIEAVKASSRSA